MTDRSALYLLIFILIFMAGDFLLTGGKGLLYLSIKFIDLVEWVSFWR